MAILSFRAFLKSAAQVEGLMPSWPGLSALFCLTDPVSSSTNSKISDENSPSVVTTRGEKTGASFFFLL